MRMERKFFGRFDMRTKVALSLAILLFATLSARAAPPEPLSDEQQAALTQTEGAWVESLLGGLPESTSYDEAIFTELSPISTAPEAVKLPSDQAQEE